MWATEYNQQQMKVKSQVNWFELDLELETHVYKLYT